MRQLLSLLALACALPACARYGPVDPTSLPRPVPAPAAAAPAEQRPPEAAPADAGSAYLFSRALVIPVAGVEHTRIRDSFDAERDGGARRHNAIDIMAPRGTPVIAADSGRILRLGTSTLGGITIYASDPAGQLVYYYAHLDGYRAGLEEGMRIARGDTLGFVGNTGNAASTPPHLHFQVMRMRADGRYWDGEPLNPFPLLARGPTLPSTGLRQAGTLREEQPREPR